MDQIQPPKAKRKKRQVAEAAGPEIEFNVGETFAPSKEADFDLNLKEMQYQAKKGQSGSRTKATNYDGVGDPNASRASNDA